MIRPLSNPLYAKGHLAILKGNLAEEGAVAKISGVKNPVITGPARVFESEESCLAAILDKQINAGDVVVVRYEGPVGGPGMREMLSPTAAIVGQGLRRFGGPDHRWPLLRRLLRPGGGPRGTGSRRGRHHRPGAGGRQHHRGCQSAADPAQRERRGASPAPRRLDASPEPRYRTGVLGKYARLVSCSSKGAVTDLA